MIIHQNPQILTLQNVSLSIDKFAKIIHVGDLEISVQNAECDKRLCMDANCETDLLAEVLGDISVCS
jgi:hypothetical protein